MRSLIYQTIAGMQIARKRLLAQPLLSLAALAGLMIAAGLLLSVPLYAEATHFRLLREELLLDRSAEVLSRPADYAPLNFIFEYAVTRRESPQWADVESLDRYLTQEAPRRIGLPMLADRPSVLRRFHTGAFQLYPPFDPALPASRYILEWVSLALISPLEQAVEILPGGGLLPSPSGEGPGERGILSPLPALGEGPGVRALVSEALAMQLGLQVGETYYLRRSDDSEIQVVISGLWRPLDPLSPLWDTGFELWLLVDEADYRSTVSAAVFDELSGSRWLMTLDGGDLHANQVGGLLRRIQSVEQRAALLLPETALVVSNSGAAPLAALERYQENAPRLTALLLAFSVPILGLILAFISLVAGLLLDQQRAEIAILRSRGAGRLLIGWIALLQALLLGGVALVCGLPLGLALARAAGHARSFLDFSAPGELRLQYTPTIFLYGLAGMSLLLLLVLVLPSIHAANQTIIGYKQERARSLRPPFWQRAWLDLLLLLPAAYGAWYLSRLASGPALPGADSSPLLSNPLLLLVPALGLFSAALLTLRLVPPLMALAAQALRRSDSVGLLMAARYLARTPAFYSAPLLLLLLTLALSAFTASLAQTLDGQLRKQMYYQVGADLRLLELGTSSNEKSQAGGWSFRPLEEHLSLPGVLAATPVGRYPADVLLPGGQRQGTFLGIDRLSFPQAAFWQAGFARQNLGSLMNALAADANGILVPRSLLSEEGLQIGDELTLAVRGGVAGESLALTLRIVGDFELFPTWYPEDGLLLVGDLNTLFLQAGFEYPHEVWLKTAPAAEPESVVYAVRGYTVLLDLKADQSRLVEHGLNTFVKEWAAAPLQITAEQRRPERQGLFGILSAGFVASALLTALGFMLYALFSFRRRLIELGMLRAIGLSALQMSGLLAAELAFLVALGLGAGIALGLGAATTFVPYLQIGAATQAQYPPFQIEIAWPAIWQMAALFGLLFLAALGALTGLLLRMKIFQAIKLGETT